MFELIALIIFVVSTLGLIAMLYSKVPQLVKLPQNGSIGFKKHDFLVRIENKIKDTHFHLFEKQMLLHKILSYAKVYALRIERKIDGYLHQIRKNSQQLDKKSKEKK
jgi:hypothetical protein